ncbi:MAG: DUF3109 family protein [Bacteroidetes bacterium]|nr:DUF3109 family protein [Bacteroidota bacterium]
MIIVGDKLISEDILEQEFICNLSACGGACCVEGDSGAPLNDEEAGLLEEELEQIKPFLRPEGLKEIDEQGVFVIDSDGDVVTPLVEGKECAFTVFDEKGTAFCGIENAWKAGKTKFRKPVSCHLYPIRVLKLPEYEALNYNRWKICAPACVLGKQQSVPVYRFLKEALIRAYGEEWYALLEETAEAYLQHGVQDL